MKSSQREVHGVLVGDSFDESSATAAIDGVDRLIHLSGVNRGTDQEVCGENIRFAEQLASALGRCVSPPAEVIFANSIQAGNGTPYGQGKATAAQILKSAADRTGSTFYDLRLPNLFGEHGQPFYNSVVATFAHQLSRGLQPEVQDDKVLTLLHAQDAADLLVGDRPISSMSSMVVERSVSNILRQLGDVAETYSDGSIPELDSAFDTNLFNTYRSYLRPESRRIPLTRNEDARGAFFEVVRSHGSSSQTSFSTTASGVTRGNHYHRRKIERFAVLSGRATISMRRLFSDDVLSFEVDGSEPVAIDMPTLWSHNITNSGPDVLYTAFWTNEIFSPKAPDTFEEKV